jgi:hypothetical protein
MYMGLVYLRGFRIHPDEVSKVRHVGSYLNVLGVCNILTERNFCELW